jgi:hypothetical protein
VIGYRNVCDGKSQVTATDLSRLEEMLTTRNGKAFEVVDGIRAAMIGCLEPIFLTPQSCLLRCSEPSTCRTRSGSGGVTLLACPGGGLVVRASEARSSHVDFRAETESSRKAIGGHVEHDSLAGSQCSQNAACEGVLVEFDLS